MKDGNIVVVEQITLVLVVLVSIFAPNADPQIQPPSNAASYLGFDRNDYPGDDILKALRKTFSYAGYWLNNPPNAKTNTWTGKRSKLQSADFGFLVLFNGRL